MSTQEKSGTRVSEDPEAVTRHPLQAILLADSFATKFLPITVERPKVLLPLVNVPMIDYTLAWLKSVGVHEVFVFCSEHSQQVIEHLENSDRCSSSNLTVTTIESHSSTSARNALDLIHGDFVLVSGDTVSNMSLTEAILEHKERGKKDDNAVMTMVVRRSKPHKSRLGSDELFLAVNPQTKQLMHYEGRADNHSDLQECYIDICSRKVLSLFTDNFDYQHLRHHFVKRILDKDIVGYKIFTYEMDSSYVARINNYRSYATISKDIIKRLTYPCVPDVIGHYSIECLTDGIYRASEIQQSCSAQIGSFTVIGKGTRIGNNSKILDSVIGKGCAIGSNVLVVGCYLWDNVTIEDGCELRHAIVCDGVIIKSGAVLQPGVVLSFKVVIGPQFFVPADSKASLLQKPTIQGSDVKLEYAGNDSGIVDSCDVHNFIGKTTSEPSEKQQWRSSELGTGGAGYIWTIPEGGHDEWMHSFAPFHADKRARVMDAIEEALSNIIAQLNDDLDDYVLFREEVNKTLQRAVDENVKVWAINLEMDSLRLSYNMTSAECATSIVWAMMQMALQKEDTGTSGLFTNITSLIYDWRALLIFYCVEEDDQVEVINEVEELCLDLEEECFKHIREIVSFLYYEDIIKEDAILRWANEKKDAPESEKSFVKNSGSVFQILK